MEILNWLGTLPGAVGQGFVWGIAAIGIFITFKILDVADLTVDGSIVTGGAVCATLLTKGVNVGVAMFVALLAGLLAGLVTGLLHTFFGIPVILAGILTQLSLYTINLLIMGGSSIVALSRFEYGDKVLIATGTSQIGRTLLILFGIILLISAALYWFFGTEFGMSLRATGNNRNMSRAQGINTAFTTVFGLALSNGIVALAGSLLAQQQGASDINMGKGAIVIGLAAVVVGEAIFSRISNNFFVQLLGVVVGAVVYFFVYQTVIFLGLPSQYLKFLSALVVAIFLGVPYLKKTFFAKKKKKEVAKDA